MCLVVDLYRHERTKDGYPIPAVAQEDMVVVKFLDARQFFEVPHKSLLDTPDFIALVHPKPRYVTPYFQVPVDFEDDEAVLTAEMHIEQGPIDSFSEASYFLVSEGIHAVREEYYYPTQYPYTPFVAIIPKGTRFFYGQDGDIVAEKLIIKYKEYYVYKHENTPMAESN